MVSPSRQSEAQVLAQTWHTGPWGPWRAVSLSPAFWGSPFGPGIRPVLRGGAPEQAGCAEGPQDEDVSLLF